MAINKLVYFAYEGLLLQEGLLLTDAKIEAWEHGPVFRELYQAFKHLGDRPIKGRAEFYSVDSGEVETVKPSLSQDLDANLRLILQPYMKLSASKLREVSHVPGGAWDEVWSYEGYANPGMEITAERILNLYAQRIDDE